MCGNETNQWGLKNNTIRNVRWSTKNKIITDRQTDTETGKRLKLKSDIPL